MLFDAQDDETTHDDESTHDDGEIGELDEDPELSSDLDGYESSDDDRPFNVVASVFPLRAQSGASLSADSSFDSTRTFESSPTRVQPTMARDREISKEKSPAREASVSTRSLARGVGGSTESSFVTFNESFEDSAKEELVAAALLLLEEEVEEEEKVFSREEEKEHLAALALPVPRVGEPALNVATAYAPADYLRSPPPAPGASSWAVERDEDEDKENSTSVDHQRASGALKLSLLADSERPPLADVTSEIVPFHPSPYLSSTPSQYSFGPSQSTPAPLFNSYGGSSVSPNTTTTVYRPSSFLQSPPPAPADPSATAAYVTAAAAADMGHAEPHRSSWFTSRTSSASNHDMVASSGHFGRLAGPLGMSFASLGPPPPPSNARHVYHAQTSSASAELSDEDDMRMPPQSMERRRRKLWDTDKAKPLATSVGDQSTSDSSFGSPFSSKPPRHESPLPNGAKPTKLLFPAPTPAPITTTGSSISSPDEFANTEIYSDYPARIAETPESVAQYPPLGPSQASWLQLSATLSEAANALADSSGTTMPPAALAASLAHVTGTPFASSLGAADSPITRIVYETPAPDLEQTTNNQHDNYSHYHYSNDVSIDHIEGNLTSLGVPSEAGPLTSPTSAEQHTLPPSHHKQQTQQLHLGQGKAFSTQTPISAPHPSEATTPPPTETRNGNERRAAPRLDALQPHYLNADKGDSSVNEEKEHTFGSGKQLARSPLGSVSALVDQWGSDQQDNEHDEDVRFESPTKRWNNFGSSVSSRDDHGHDDDNNDALLSPSEFAQETPTLTFAARKKERLRRAQREAMSSFQGTPFHRIADSPKTNYQTMQERSPSRMRVKSSSFYFVLSHSMLPPSPLLRFVPLSTLPYICVSSFVGGENDGGGQRHLCALHFPEKQTQQRTHFQRRHADLLHVKLAAFHTFWWPAQGSPQCTPQQPSSGQRAESGESLSNSERDWRDEEALE
jgi:hypothetical protein